MKRFHVGMRVDDLESSIRFYTALFGVTPTRLENDYAKWMLEDPRVNFSISTRCDTSGDIHMGIQVENEEELDEVTDRLKSANMTVRETPEVTCCYAKSDKTWTADPKGLPWETFLTRGPTTVYGDETLTKEDVDELKAGACCG